MEKEQLKKFWLNEERIAHIKGWDFSYINSRYHEDPLPWNYEEVVNKTLCPEMKLLDIDTGGGEVLLKLEHPHENTSATEGYAPNVELCRQRLVPLGIDFRECSDISRLPFQDESFDIVINRHGSFSPKEIKRVLKPGGVFITQQVGAENDRDLVEMVLPGTEKPFPDETMEIQKTLLEKEGFDIVMAQEAFLPIIFTDVGAFVWFAKIIEWEFPEFSVEKCFEQLLNMHERCKMEGKIKGTIHRFIFEAVIKKTSLP